MRGAAEILEGKGMLLCEPPLRGAADSGEREGAAFLGAPSARGAAHRADSRRGDRRGCFSMSPRCVMLQRLEYLRREGAAFLRAGLQRLKKGRCCFHTSPRCAGLQIERLQ